MRWVLSPQDAGASLVRSGAACTPTVQALSHLQFCAPASLHYRLQSPGDIETSPLADFRGESHDAPLTQLC